MRKIIFLLILSLFVVRPALGQEGVIFYGMNTVGSLSADSSQAEFTFGGTAGDLVTIEAVGITAGLDPALSVNSPAGQNLASNDNDGSGTTDAHISFSLPESGAYTILVTSVTGASGDFLLRLNGHAPLTATALTDAPVDVSVTADSPQIFSFSTEGAGAVTLNVATTTENFGFRVTVRNANGHVVALVDGTDIVAASLSFAPDSATYTAEIIALDPAIPGQVSISIGGSTAAVQSVSPLPSPEQTEEVMSCGITPNRGLVNVRSGPSTTFDIIAELEPSKVLAVTGTANFWYQVNVPDVGTGWVSDTVVFTTGVCDSVPEVVPPVQPTQTATIDPHATLTFTPAPQQPTATFTPAPPVQATPTFTPAAPQPSVTPTQAQLGPTATVTITVTTTPTN